MPERVLAPNLAPSGSYDSTDKGHRDAIDPHPKHETGSTTSEAHDMEQREHNRLGFTILELMVVIVIMGVLGGILTINLVGAADKAKIAATKTSMKTVKSALAMYRTEYAEYPPTGSLELLRAENMITKEMVDSWGVLFDYYSPTQNSAFAIISAGPDKQFETDDDIWMEADPE